MSEAYTRAYVLQNFRFYILLFFPFCDLELAQTNMSRELLSYRLIRTHENLKIQVTVCYDVLSTVLLRRKIAPPSVTKIAKAAENC